MILEFDCKTQHLENRMMRFGKGKQRKLRKNKRRKSESIDGYYRFGLNMYIEQNAKHHN